MRRALWIIAALALAGCNTGEEVAVGALEWDRVELIAEASEPIIEIARREGEQVARGDLILRLDPRRMLARLTEAQAARDEAAARLAELERGPRAERIAEARARLRGAQEQLEIRRRELRRLQQLAKDKLASPGSVDTARRELDAALAERDRARATLDELESGTTSEELDQARQALARAEAAVRAAEVDLERLSVRAPVTGRLDDLPYELGEQPPVGNVVAVLLTGERPYARVYVPEAQRIRVTPGTRAEVHVDGLAEPLAGTVRRVAADPTFTPYFALTEYDRGRLSYLAEVDLEGAVGELPAGVPVQVTFPDAGIEGR
jgi:HlyD family secretion protein